MPSHVDGDVLHLIERAFEPPLADVTPRAHHVGDDIDRKGL
jgi:hypothetical protein